MSSTWSPPPRPLLLPTVIFTFALQENKFHPEVVEHIYQHNPILKYTQGPLYAPLLPFPYGSLEHTCEYFTSPRHLLLQQHCEKLLHFCIFFSHPKKCL